MLIVGIEIYGVMVRNLLVECVADKWYALAQRGFKQYNYKIMEKSNINYGNNVILHNIEQFSFFAGHSQKKTLMMHLSREQSLKKSMYHRKTLK